MESKTEREEAVLDQDINLQSDLLSSSGPFHQYHSMITKKASETEKGITESENLLNKILRSYNTYLT